jgi:hypothetical protein
MGSSGGGQSAGGGGGGSGQVDYPEYMKTFHTDLLSQGGTDTIEASLVEIMNAALGASPFAGETAYNPDTPLADAWDAVCAFNAVVDALNHSSDWQTAIVNAVTVIDANVITAAYVAAEVTAYAATIDDNFDNVELPKFRYGMRDINAVNTSSFTIGEALITGIRNRDVATYTANLRGKLVLQRNEMVMQATERIINSLMARVEFERAVAAVSVDAKRIHIVAKKEEDDKNLTIAEADGKWDLEVFQHGANALAGIGGGTAATSSSQKQPSTVQSALAGALSGAVMGAQVGGLVGGPPGAGAGAAAGAVIGIGMSLMSR